MKTFRFAFLPSLVILASTSALAQLEDLGGGPDTFLEVADMSPDGSAMGGGIRDSSGTTRPWRWTEADGLTILPPVSSVIAEVDEVSDDGRFALGTRNNRRGYRWLPDGSVQYLGTPAGNPSHINKALLSGDGQTVLASGSNSSTTVFLSRWTSFSGWVDLALPFPHNFVDAFWVNYDGSKVVARVFSAPSTQAIRWDASTGTFTEIVASGLQSFRLDSVSDDGDVIAGVVKTSALDLHGFRWTPAGGMEILTELTGETINGTRARVSADGSAVFVNVFRQSGPTSMGIWRSGSPYEEFTFNANSSVLETNSDGTVFLGRESVGGLDTMFLWSRSSGVQSLDFPGVETSMPRFLSADGQKVGLSLTVLGAPVTDRHVMRLRVDGEIGQRYCGPAQANSSGGPGSLQLSGTNLLALGQLDLIVDGLPAQSVGFCLCSASQGFLPNPAGSQGNLCLSGSIGRFLGPGQVQSTGPTGFLSLRIDPRLLPGPNGSVMPISGETWNFQTWFRDANPTSTSNLTNGVTVTLF